MTPAEFRDTRKRLGLTQAGLADIFGVSLKTIVNIEAEASPKFGLYALALCGLMAERGIVTSETA